MSRCGHWLDWLDFLGCTRALKLNWAKSIAVWHEQNLSTRERVLRIYV